MKKGIIFLCFCLLFLSACSTAKQPTAPGGQNPGARDKTDAQDKAVDKSAQPADNTEPKSEADRILELTLDIDKTSVKANEDFIVKAVINSPRDMWAYVRLYVDDPGVVYEVSGVYPLSAAKPKTITKTWNAAALPAGEQKIKLAVYDAETIARAFGKSIEKLPELLSSDIADRSAPLAEKILTFNIEKDNTAGSCKNDDDCVQPCGNCAIGSQICVGGEQKCADCLSNSSCKSGFRCSDRQCIEDISARNLRPEDTAACPIKSNVLSMADLIDPASREQALAQKDAGYSLAQAIIIDSPSYRAACAIEAPASHFFRFSHGKKQEISISYSGAPAVYKYMGPDFERQEYIPKSSGSGITTMNTIMFDEGYFYLEVSNAAGGGTKKYSLQISSTPYNP